MSYGTAGRFAKYESTVGLCAVQERPDDRIFTAASAITAGRDIYSRNGLTRMRLGAAIAATITGMVGMSAQQERSGAHRPFDRE